jgi:hypothetical protein
MIQRDPKVLTAVEISALKVRVFGKKVSYVFTKPKTTDLNRIQGVFSSRRGIIQLKLS